MSSVSMGGGCSASLYSSLQTSQARQPDKLQELIGKLDTNGDNAIDSDEIQSFADHVGGKTGATLDAGALLTSLDSNGDGSLSEDEFAAVIQHDPGRKEGVAGAGFARSDGLGRMLESLLADYGVAASGAALQGSTLDVAA